ncbi:hypothetical protein [Stackebrandtia albiflava]|uniref:hypothetical protein n=1 Tax=Stackebrandtia albiflava TaxID=406432 RepID=UPI001315852D|nr:hypothetical protein [Stackebrandtia albiflava]
MIGRPVPQQQAPQDETAPQYDQEPVQPFAPAHDPTNPASAQPYQVGPAPGQPYQAPVSVQPASGQPYHAPASGQPYHAPASGQPYQAPASGQPQYAPPGVPESPFAAAPTPTHLPTPVSASPTSAQPWAGGVVPQFTPKRSKGVPGWIYVVGAIVVVAALAVGAVFFFGMPGTGTSADEGDPTPSTQASEEPVPEGGGELLTDSETGLGYLSLPTPWAPLADNADFAGVPGLAEVTGQYCVTEEPNGDNRGWTGVVAVGALDTGAVEYTGADAMRNTVVALGETVDAGYWKDPADPDADLAELARAGDATFQYLRIDGRRAIMMTYQVTWAADSTQETGATVTVGIVDLGGGDAAAFFAQVPGSVAEEQGPAVDAALLTLQFG